MDRPYITINNEFKFMPTPKSRMWRELMKFEEERANIKAVDAVEKYCEIIAKVFGVSTDEVLDNLDLEDVLPTYFDILNCIAALLTDKLVTDKKNIVDVETQA